MICVCLLRRLLRLFLRSEDVYVHFLPASAENEPKETPLKGEKVSRTKTQRSRIFARFNILSPLRIPLTCCWKAND